MDPDLLTKYGLAHEDMVCCCCGHIGREDEPYEIECLDGEFPVCPKCGKFSNGYSTYAMACLWKAEHLQDIAEDFGWAPAEAAPDTEE